MRKTGLQPDTFGRYLLDGGDMLAAHHAACRRFGIASFVSLRLNDAHHQEHYGETTARSIWVSRFYEEHLDCQIDPGQKQRKGYYGVRGLDWSRPAVGEYKLALARELCAYDVDGIELDVLRDHHLFSKGVALDERVRILAAFVRGVRQALDAGRAGRWLSVRIPLDPGAYAECGIDVAALRAAGVDIFNLSPWYSTTQRTDGIGHVAKAAPGAAIYFELTHSVGDHQYFGPRELGYGNHLYAPRCPDHLLCTTARLALEGGAHGISLFNFAYYRRIQHWETDTPAVEPPFHLLGHLTDRAWLARQPALFHLSRTSYFSQVPRRLAPGTAQSFRFEILPPDPRMPNPDAAFAPVEPAWPQGQGRLRVHTKLPLADGGRLQARWNGRRLEPCGDTGRFFGDPYDPLISPAHHRAAFTVPKEALTAGVATLELTVAGEAIEVIYLDLGIP
jgi:hypothetical protein